MSRQQIAQFSVFLMQWISDKANHEAVSKAVTRAIKAYSDDRGSSQVSLSDFRYDFDVDMCSFKNFSKDDFFQLCGLLPQSPRVPLSPAAKLIHRISAIKNEYDRSLKLITEKKTTSVVNASQCEYWRRAEFSKEEIELLQELVSSSQASVLWAKLPTELSEREEMGFQFYLEKARKMADQVSDVARTVAAAACSKAIDLTSTNSAAFFPSASLGSPNARDFLLSIDSKMGEWEVASTGLFSGHTSLKTRMIHEVCHAYFVARYVEQDVLAGARQEEESEFLEVPEKAVQLQQEQPRSTRSSSSSSHYEQQEAKFLQLYAHKAISPLTKPGHALQIYQSLLAIDCNAKVMKLFKEQVAEHDQVKAEKEGSVGVGLRSHERKLVATLSVPPQHPSTNALLPVVRNEDDDVDLNDNRRSTTNFAVSALPH